VNVKMYKTAEAFRAALEARAKKICVETGEGLDMVRRKLAFDAFLCRVEPSGVPLVLKGGYLLHLRYQTGVRPTKDLDAALQEGYLAQQKPEVIQQHMREALQTVAAAPTDDFFSFEIGEAMADLGEGREFVGIRFNVKTKIGSRVYDSFHADCTVGDALIAPLDSLKVGAGLEFVGLSSAHIQAIGPGQHFAEKLHALCRPRTRTSSRAKDLFDMVLFIKRGVSPETVASALPTVFALCCNTPVPASLPQIPREWRSRYEQMAKENNLEDMFDQACTIVTNFYAQIFNAIHK